MEEKNIERFDIFNNNELNRNDIQQNFVGNNNLNQNNNQENVNNNFNQVWPNAQFSDDNSTNFQINNMIMPQFDNTPVEQVSPVPAPIIEEQPFVSSVQTVTPPVEPEVQVEQIKKEEKIQKNNNGYEEKTSYALVFIILVLLALIIIFLPQLSNLI